MPLVFLVKSRHVLKSLNIVSEERKAIKKDITLNNYLEHESNIHHLLAKSVALNSLLVCEIPLLKYKKIPKENPKQQK